MAAHGRVRTGPGGMRPGAFDNKLFGEPLIKFFTVPLPYEYKAGE